MTILQHMRFKSISMDSQALGSWQRPYDCMMDMDELLIKVRRKRGSRRYCIETGFMFIKFMNTPVYAVVRQWQPTPVFLPRESHGQRSLVDYSPWDH